MSKLTNREKVENIVKELGYIIGCWDDGIDKLNSRAITRIANRDFIEQDYAEIKFSTNKVYYVAELSTVGEEKDFCLSTLEEYETKYNRKYGD